MQLIGITRGTLIRQGQRLGLIWDVRLSGTTQIVRASHDTFESMDTGESAARGVL